MRVALKSVTTWKRWSGIQLKPKTRISTVSLQKTLLDLVLILTMDWDTVIMSWISVFSSGFISKQIGTPGMNLLEEESWLFSVPEVSGRSLKLVLSWWCLKIAGITLEVFLLYLLWCFLTKAQLHRVWLEGCVWVPVLLDGWSVRFIISFSWNLSSLLDSLAPTLLQTLVWLAVKHTRGSIYCMNSKDMVKAILYESEGHDSIHKSLFSSASKFRVLLRSTILWKTGRGEQMAQPKAQMITIKK